MSEFNVGFVIFAGITQLDFTGPFEVLSRLGTPPSLSVPSKFAQARTHVIAKTMEPVLSDRGLSLLPTCTFQDCPQLDLICVPGGAGVIEALADADIVDFIRRQAGDAQYVTSVCTGAFLLGAAGLLRGRRATTHWAHADLLPLVGNRAWGNSEGDRKSGCAWKVVGIRHHCFDQPYVQNRVIFQ